MCSVPICRAVVAHRSQMYFYGTLSCHGDSSVSSASGILPKYKC